MVNNDKELVPLNMLKKSDSGKCFVPYRKLMELSQEEIQEIEFSIQNLSETHPEYTFYTEHDPIAGGVKISWKRND